MFELSVIAALVYIAFQMWRLVRQQAATNRFIVSALKLPPESVLVTDGTVSAGLTVDPPNTVVEEFRQFARLIAYRLRNIEGAVGYLRNYTWEQLDERTREEIEHPKPSTWWGGKTFQAPDSDTYGLWPRERDYDIGFSRAMNEAAPNKAARPAPPPEEEKGIRPPPPPPSPSPGE